MDYGEEKSRLHPEEAESDCRTDGGGARACVSAACRIAELLARTTAIGGMPTSPTDVRVHVLVVRIVRHADGRGEAQSKQAANGQDSALKNNEETHGRLVYL